MRSQMLFYGEVCRENAAETCNIASSVAAVAQHDLKAMVTT